MFKKANGKVFDVVLTGFVGPDELIIKHIMTVINQKPLTRNIRKIETSLLLSLVEKVVFFDHNITFFMKGLDLIFCLRE